jgi:hypothetical protein
LLSTPFVQKRPVDRRLAELLEVSGREELLGPRGGSEVSEEGKDLKAGRALGRGSTGRRRQTPWKVIRGRGPV